jgi:hypothetical protein
MPVMIAVDRLRLLVITILLNGIVTPARGRRRSQPEALRRFRNQSRRRAVAAIHFVA